MNRVALGMAALLAIGCGTIGVAQPPNEVRRLRGIIDKDETWSGTILITDNLTIDGATVRVMPGTVIEFAGGEHRAPTLNIGKLLGQSAVPGRLEMNGKADQRIVVRTAAGSGRGRVVVSVRNKLVINRKDEGTIKESVTTTQAADQVDWQHVDFERLGSLATGRAVDHEVDYSKPGVQFQIREGGQEVNLEDCRFTECTHLLVQSGADAEVSIRKCRFEKSVDQTAARIVSNDERSQAKSLEFADNVAAGMVAVAAGPAVLSGNRIIGSAAGIAVRKEAAGEIRVESNYVHCTEESDKGRYVLTVEQPEAVVRDNVLIGGAYVVYQGSRRMSGNVLIAAPRLTNDKGGRARTLRLVGSLPAGSTFEDNVLIGPALSLIGPQRPLRPASADAAGGTGENTPTRVRHNVFDGVDGQTRAVLLGLKRELGGPVEFFDNVVLRCGAMVSDSAPEADALLFADYNAVIGGPDLLFQRAGVSGRRAGEEGWSKNDRRVATAADAGLAAPPERMPDLNSEVASGAVTIAEALRRFVAPYRTRAGSPLIGAGRPDGSREARGNIGLSAKIDK